ncbi:MAG: hypothetical protein ABIE94_07255 [archaeon]
MAKEKGEKDSYVGIAAVLGGILFVIIFMFLIFAKEHLIYTVSIAWAFVVLGVFLGLFSMLSGKKKK